MMRTIVTLVLFVVILAKATAIPPCATSCHDTSKRLMLTRNHGNVTILFEKTYSFHTKIYYAVYCVEQRVLHYFYLFLSHGTREERALTGGQVRTGILGN